MGARAKVGKRKLGLLAVGALVALFVLPAAPAGATQTFVFKEVFGPAFQPSVVQDFGRGPGAMAVDPATGDLLVTDVADNTLSRFKPNGEPDPFPALGSNTIDGKLGPGGKPCAEEPASCDLTPQGIVVDAESPLETGVAVAPPGAAAGTAGDIYLTDTGHHVLHVFAPSGKFLGLLSKYKDGTEKTFGEVCGVAVDGAGAVYVGDFSRQRVHRYVPTSNPPLTADNTANFSAVPHPCGLAAGIGPSAGFVFAVDYRLSSQGSSKGKAYKLDSTTGALQYVFGVGQDSAGLNGFGQITADPASGHVLAATPSDIREYDVSAAAEAQFVSSFKGRDALGLAVDPAGELLYASVFSSEYLPNISHVDTYRRAAVPAVTAEAATEIAADSAVLHGTVDPDGVAIGKCAFEYGTIFEGGSGGGGPIYDHTAPCEGPVPADHKAHPVSATLSGLEPAKTYHFRLAATNANATIYSARQDFTTKSGALSVQTTAAGPVGGATATLNGVVAPAGSTVTECLFEYGVTTSYGATAPCAGSVPADAGEHPVSAVLAHLVPNGATYHFRLMATAPGSGTVHGDDRSFTTKDTVVSGESSAIGGFGATLGGTLDPEGVEYAECLFEYGITTSYGQSVPCAESPASIGTGASPVAVHAELVSLSSATVYHWRLVGVNADGTARGADRSFKTLGPPLVDGEWAASVTDSEATLGSEVNPENGATTYRVEYGTTTAYGQSTPERPAGDNRSDHRLTDFLQGLAPATTYHWRIIASNSVGTTLGPDRSFRTFATFAPEGSCPNRALRTGPSASLPDCRAYEMVSPVDKNGGGADNYRLSQASLDGEKLAYASHTAFADAQSSYVVNQYVASRGAEGWVTHGVAPPLEIEGTGSGPGRALFHPNPVWAFTPDLSSVWMANGNVVPLAPGAVKGYVNLYRRDLASGSFEALTVNPPLEGSKFGLGGNILAESLVGYSQGGEQSAFQTTAQLAPEAGPLGALEDQEVYDFANGALHVASILPDGISDPRNSFGTSGVQGFVEWGQVAAHHVMSSDGSRIFWSSLRDDGQPDVYVRENPAQPESAHLHGVASGSGNLLIGSKEVASLTTSTGAFQAGQAISGKGIPDGTTIAAVAPGSLTLSAPASASGATDLSATSQCTEPARACTVELAARARFVDATPDGSHVLLKAIDGPLFTVDVDTLARTQIAGQVPEARNTGGSTDGVLGESEGLSYVYFLSEEATAPGAVAGKPNLYLDHEGTRTFIATLSSRDSTGSPSPVRVEPEEHDARVSPDGRHLAFTSESPALAESVAGYDNTDTASGKPALEVYAYEAGGALRCVSCNPSGARPSAGLLLRPLYPIDESTDSIAAAWLPTEASGIYSTRPLSDDGGRVFFEAYDALLPRDTNGAQDVYEWEAPGTGTCGESSPDYSPRNGGCLSLISTGTSSRRSEFVDASPDGRDVFIRTTSGIDPRDLGALDIYDARVSGGFPLPAESAACEGEACQGTSSPPDDTTPASASFEGAGNVREEAAPAPRRCTKGKVRRHGKCVARKHRRQAKRSGRAAR